MYGWKSKAARVGERSSDETATTFGWEAKAKAKVVRAERVLPAEVTLTR